MRPRELFLRGLDAHAVPRLADVGFRLRRSSLTFERSLRHGVRQQVSFQLSRWNADDQCEFWSTWGVHFQDYTAWLQSEWKEVPTLDSIGAAEWNIPGWSRRADRHFSLTNAPTDAAEWREFLDDVDDAGLPYLERISSFRGAAEELVRQGWHFDLAADFLLLAGDRESALETAREGIRTFEAEGRADNFGELPRLRARVKRYADSH